MKIIFWGLLGISAVLFVALFFTHLSIAIAPVIAGIFVWNAIKTQIALIKIPFTPIHLLSDGLVKIRGTITAPQTYTTPFFKQECIGYHYKKANITYDSETGSEYERDATTEEVFQDFYLADTTGKVKVTAPRINLNFLPVKTDTLHSIKYAVDDIRHSERTLKNGDTISVMGYAQRNNSFHFEIVEQHDKPLVISTSDFEADSKKSLKIFKNLLPYFVIMYLSVNYFVMFAPVHKNWPQNDALIVFAIFGMPVLGIILAIIGKNRFGFLKILFSILGGTLLIVWLLTFPLLCLLLMIKTAFYTIACVWLSIFFSVLMGICINYKKLIDLTG